MLQLDLIDGIYLQQAALVPNLSGLSVVGENRDLETLHHEERCALAVAIKSGYSEDLKLYI